MPRHEKTDAEHKRDLLAQLPLFMRNDPRWAEYSKAGEDEEGIAYWRIFPDMESLKKDFKLFCEAVT